MPSPICFMVMPFGVKQTGLDPGKGPAQVDFDALWTKAISPALRTLGYTPVRADQDTGALIIVDMLRRLACADLVVADVSIANANVYYEIGVRHAARGRNCVLISATWANPVFDLAQMRRFAYELSDGSISDAAAAAIRDNLVAKMASMIEGTSPVFEAVPNYPDFDDTVLGAAGFFDETMADLVACGRRMAEIRAIDDDVQRKAEAFALRDELKARPRLQEGVWLEMMLFLRDATSCWVDVIDWISAMPGALRARPAVQEQRILAEAKRKDGSPDRQVGALEELIRLYGASSERYGLLGGRYKTLYTTTAKAADAAEAGSPEQKELKRRAARHLDAAIDAYYQGMVCDLNDYFPSSNLPSLLRIRNQEGDEALARTAATVTTLACDREEKMGKPSPYRLPTRLVAAFQTGDVEQVRLIARRVARESRAGWILDTTLADIDRTLKFLPDTPTRAQLQKIRDEL